MHIGSIGRIREKIIGKCKYEAIAELIRTFHVVKQNSNKLPKF